MGGLLGGILVAIVLAVTVVVVIRGRHENSPTQDYDYVGPPELPPPRSKVIITSSNVAYASNIDVQGNTTSASDIQTQANTAYASSLEIQP